MVIKEFWNLVSAGRISFSTLTQIPRDGAIKEVDFQIGFPVKERLPLYIILNGHKKFLCDICSEYSNFRNMREWMERSTDYSPLGSLHPGVLSIDSEDTVTYLITCQCAWDVSQSTMTSVSILAILKSDNPSPVELAYCNGRAMIRNLYRAIRNGIRNNKEFLDDPGNWTIPYGVYTARKKTSDILISEIYSKKLESLRL